MSSLSDGSNAEPNLTPMLDMVFQLVTFFMLVINFKGAAMDLTLNLPVLGSARPLDTGGREDLLVLNVDSKGKLRVYGVEKNLHEYIAGEARLAVFKQTTVNPAFKKGDELPTMIVIRADRTTPFKLLNDVITTCQNEGFRQFSLKAMSKAEGR